LSGDQRRRFGFIPDLAALAHTINSASKRRTEVQETDIVLQLILICGKSGSHGEGDPSLLTTHF
jgi:hypothetical protein